MVVRTCPSDNAAAIDQSSFWSGDPLHWDAHRIGWAIAGGCTAVTLITTIVSVSLHCRHYARPAEQRQIIRILYLPALYGIISFLSYRFFRDYTYYSFVKVVYEAITISAFLLLLIAYVAEKRRRQKTPESHSRRPLIFPFCWIHYQPTKPYFIYAVKWAVLQYIIVRPMVSIVGIVCQKLAILCDSEGFNPHYVSVYLDAVDFASISVALYGLLIFYDLTKPYLEGRKPLAKFLCIKLMIMFTFYQSFIFKTLEGRVLHATQFWTTTNIANGLNALAICIEMMFFAALMVWAYLHTEYKSSLERPTSIWRPLWDSINYSDFLKEIIISVSYFVYPSLYKRLVKGHTTYELAFAIEGYPDTAPQEPSNDGQKVRSDLVTHSGDMPLSELAGRRESDMSRQAVNGEKVGVP